MDSLYLKLKKSSLTSRGCSCTQMYIMANSILDEKRSLLLTVVGQKMYGLLWSLIAPALSQEKSFAELVEKLKVHFSPKPIVIAELFQFY